MRKLRTELDVLGHHINWQRLHEKPLERGFLHAGLRLSDHDRVQQVAELVVRHRDDRRLDRLMAAEGRLDLAKLDPVTPGLDLMVTAAKEAQITVGEAAHKVTGLISELRLPVPGSDRPQGPCRQILAPPVTFHQGAAADPQLTDLAVGQKLQAFVKNEALAVFALPANRN